MKYSNVKVRVTAGEENTLMKEFEVISVVLVGLGNGEVLQGAFQNLHSIYKVHS